MKKNILLLIAFIIISLLGKSQDTIIKVDGNKIPAKVIEIELNSIKYKKLDNIDGPNYNILKTEVWMVKYQNGKSDIFYKKDELITRENGRNYYKGSRISNDSVAKILKVKASNEISQNFNIGFKCKIAGTGLMIVGGFGIISGISLISLSSHDIGLVILLTGAGVAVVGIPLIAFGKSFMKLNIAKYNNYLATAYVPTLNMGFTQNGVGFTLKF